MKKQTFLNEPEEFPVAPPSPEIERPGDPTEPYIPQEAPDTQPQELPDERPFPEIKPDEPQPER